jgi:uncharacterized membrane protein YqhA
MTTELFWVICTMILFVLVGMVFVAESGCINKLRKICDDNTESIQHMRSVIDDIGTNIAKSFVAIDEIAALKEAIQLANHQLAGFESQYRTDQEAVRALEVYVLQSRTSDPKPKSPKKAVRK